ncbi:N-acetylmuramoyl-L-alanine amidase [Streptomyces sp. JJ36]|uniref:N-acetylmuramoyl-L-alanine amidase n=1 Tax=Streptomyces sp. JJ36 TaxID=2736645 RepID=UPI001EFFBE05|nr:N-acetylmuramoyl-L-alanine amidase [Streptomyces sp. JJ36]MCF6524676.1 N-acetylmuramoyl-L-alanine amidase [Streptomyces sp. JJ36]
MRPTRLALAAAMLPLALLIRWGDPVHDLVPGRDSARPAAGPAAPRPELTRRPAWGADEELVRESPAYVEKVRAVFIHHTNHPNTYDCADVPAMLRGLQRDHVRRMGWDDIGYNYVVDRCGNIYEGRGGGVGRKVLGAHTRGFNTASVGIAALGTFPAGAHVPRPMLDAVAAVAAWKLEPSADPRGRVRLVSTNSESRFHKGTEASLPVVAGHRDSFETRCPGEALYDALPWLRAEVARLRR